MKHDGWPGHLSRVSSGSPGFIVGRAKGGSVGASVGSSVGAGVTGGVVGASVGSGDGSGWGVGRIVGSDVATATGGGVAPGTRWSPPRAATNEIANVAQAATKSAEATTAGVM